GRAPVPLRAFRPASYLKGSAADIRESWLRELPRLMLAGCYRPPHYARGRRVDLQAWVFRGSRREHLLRAEFGQILAHGGEGQISGGPQSHPQRSTGLEP